jgi:hypothetical protein
MYYEITEDQYESFCTFDEKFFSITAITLRKVLTFSLFITMTTRFPSKSFAKENFNDLKVNSRSRSVETEVEDSTSNKPFTEYNSGITVSKNGVPYTYEEKNPDKLIPVYRKKAEMAKKHNLKEPEVLDNQSSETEVDEEKSNDLKIYSNLHFFILTLLENKNEEISNPSKEIEASTSTSKEIEVEDSKDWDWLEIEDFFDQMVDNEIKPSKKEEEMLMNKYNSSELYTQERLDYYKNEAKKLLKVLNLRGGSYIGIGAAKIFLFKKTMQFLKNNLKRVKKTLLEGQQEKAEQKKLRKKISKGIG